jgi:hypothetical protein
MKILLSMLAVVALVLSVAVLRARPAAAEATEQQYEQVAVAFGAKWPGVGCGGARPDFASDAHYAEYLRDRDELLELGRRFGDAKMRREIRQHGAEGYAPAAVRRVSGN